MPVINYVPQDPTDRVLQGEQLRQSVFDPMDLEQPTAMIGGYFQTPLMSITQDEDAFSPMNSFICINRLSVRRSKSGEKQIRQNAGIATPCGAWISMDWPPLLRRFEQATNSFTIVGQTVTGAGAALGNVRVVVYETGRIHVPVEESPARFLTQSPVVAETYSDGSGNFSMAVPMNLHYQLTGYLTGSPDRAGITRNDVVPTATQTLIYLRDPTTADAGGGGYATRVIGSPVVRRIAA
jgi:hypothetical protein